MMLMMMMILSCSFVTLCKCWWRLWMRPLHTTYAASNPMTSRWPSRELSSQLLCMLFWDSMIWFFALEHHHLSSGLIHSDFIDCGNFLFAGLIPNVLCSSSEPVASWKLSASLLQVSHPGTDESLHDAADSHRILLICDVCLKHFNVCRMQIWLYP